MEINGLNKQDKKHVKSLLSSLDFLAIKNFLIIRNAYTPHNRSELLLEILLMGDYKTASDIIEEDKLSPIDYITIAKFGDENVFDYTFYALTDEEHPKLAQTLINNFDKTFEVFEKCESIVKLDAIDEAVLKAICVDGREEILKYFICYLNIHKAKGNNASVLKKLVKTVIGDNNLSHLKMLLRYITLTDEEVLSLGHDQFSWYASQKYISDSLIDAIYGKLDTFRFKMVLKVRKLNDNQIKTLFDSD